MKKLLLFTTALALVALQPLSSPCTQIVHDPGNAALNTQNLVQTTTTALKQVAAYSQQVQQYQLQLQQYANELKNTLGIAQAAQIWQSAQQTMGSVMGTVNMFRSGGGLDSYLQNARDVNYWLSAPPSQYTSQPAGYWSTTQKTANDQLVQEIANQERQMEVDAQNLERLQQQAGSAAGQMQALTAANQLAALEQQQLLQIRALLVSQQQALAARNGTVANDEAMKQAATQQYFGTQLAPQNHTGW